LQDVYNNRYPSGATNNNLDDVLGIVNSQRKQAQKGAVSAYLFSRSPNITIVSGNTATKDIVGDTEEFTLTTDVSIGSNVSAVVLNDFADEGILNLYFDNDDSELIEINYNDQSTAIKSKLEAHSKIVEVEVFGEFEAKSCIVVQFTQHTLGSIIPSFGENTLKRFNVPLNPRGFYSSGFQAAFFSNSTAGEEIPIASVTKPTGSSPFFDGLVNFGAGISGKPRETDAEFRARTLTELQKAGTATPNGCVEAIMSLEGVTSASVIENDTAEDFTGSGGLPPHSYEVFVVGGNDDDIAQKIYDTKPCGIGTATTTSGEFKRQGNYVDVNGQERVREFSAPILVTAYISFNITTNSNFPEDGLEQLRNNIITWLANNKKLRPDGGNVILREHELYTPINRVAGVTSVTSLGMTDIDGGSYDKLTISAGNTGSIVSSDQDILINGVAG